MSTQRTEISAEELHFLLTRAFDRIRPLRCRACALPQPHPAVPMDNGPNWVLPVSSTCDLNCMSFMRWLWRQYGALYDLKPPA